VPQLNVPQLNVRPSVPASQLRPLPQAGPATHPGPPTSPPAARPPTRPRRRAPMLGAVAVVLVAALATVGIVYATKHGGSSPSAGPSASSTPGTDQSLDAFFHDDVLRDYVRPTYGEITSCQRGFAAGSATAVPVPYSATCVFKNGIQVAFAKADSQQQITSYRDSIAQYLPAANMTLKKDDWAHGGIDQYTNSAVNALYWDDSRTLIYAFASVSAGTLSISKMRDWWGTRFEK
jgi:hypothetical protein